MYSNMPKNYFQVLKIAWVNARYGLYTILKLIMHSTMQSAKIF